MSDVGCLGIAGAVVAIIGRPKASVLPDPVGARAATSRPAMMSGITDSWTGKGASIPDDRTTARIGSGRPRSANVEGIGFGPS